jgi:hypothetical protein
VVEKAELNGDVDSDNYHGNFREQFRIDRALHEPHCSLWVYLSLAKRQGRHDGEGTFDLPQNL